MSNREPLLFGTAGIPNSVPRRERSVENGIRRIRKLGLGCMEVEFVHGVDMSRQTALAVGETAAALGIKLSAHAPYYLNLNSEEPGKVAATRERILQTARITYIFGGDCVVFHPAYYMKKPPSEVFDTVKHHVEQIASQLWEEGSWILLRPEVMGKVTAFGTMDEVLELSAEIDGVAPAVDFAHWHARTGQANSYEEFTGILKHIERKLGRDALDNMHIHVSGIDYGPRGERKHLNLEESDLNYFDLMMALKERGVGGKLICESPNLEEDALLLQQVYLKL